MGGSTSRFAFTAMALLAVLMLGVGCSGTRLVDGDTFVARASQARTLPVSGSGSDDLVVLPDRRTTLPPPIVRSVPSASQRFVKTAAQPDEFAPPPPPDFPAPSAELSPAPGSASTSAPPTWSTPAPVDRPVVRTTTGAPPPPPPGTSSVRTVYAPTTTTMAPSQAYPPARGLSSRCWSGCGLPCEDGVSSWHVRLVGGWPFYEGTDAPEPCSYWGVDLGRTHCGCWGYSLYYRMDGCKYDREGDPTLTKDGGIFHHVGAKLEWERSLGSSKFYWWVGVGGGYYWTQDFIDDADGWEVFGETGFGYVINKTFRIRAGVNVHGADVSTGRAAPVNRGSARWIWLIAPVVELEIDF